MIGKNWCFTVNNYSEEEGVKLAEDLEEVCSYYILGKEVGEEGTPHIQGYAVFEKTKRLPGVKKINGRAHWEVAKGTSGQNIEYCQKEGDYYEYGSRPKTKKELGQKEKERWARMVQQAKSGNLEELEKENPREYVAYLNKWRSLEEIQVTELDGVCGLWIYGPTGTGKSHSVYKQHPGCYMKPLNKWWDGYKNQKVVWIDEVSPEHTTKFGAFLKIWADKFPFRAEFKGGSKVIRPEKVIVTSNYSIDEMGFHPNDVMALKRRYHEVFKHDKTQGIIV